MKLGKEFARIRRQGGHTQKSLADALGYTSPQFVSNWERDLALVPLDKLRKFFNECKASWSQRQFVANTMVEIYRIEIERHINKGKRK